MAEYLILISADSTDGLTLEEEQKCIAAYDQWAEKLGEKHLLARRLDFSPGDLLGSKRKPLTDGPFIEAKELIAGLILLKAESQEEATEHAKACPLNDYFHLFVKKAME